MFKRLSLIFLVSLLLLMAAGCTTPITPALITSEAAASPTSRQVPSAINLATPVINLATVVPASPVNKVPTPIRPPTTVTLSPVNPIRHFTPGQRFTVTAIHMLDAKSGWSIGSLTQNGDHVLFTRDGGLTWIDVTPPETAAQVDQFKSAIGYFLDAQTAWVVYGYGFNIPGRVSVWRTQDGGNSWRESWPLDLVGITEAFTPSAMQFVDGKNGWVLVHVGAGMNHEYVALYHTVDGGISWTRLIDPYTYDGIQPCSKTAVLFTDAMNGWLTGDCGGVAQGVLLFQSSDGGATWQDVVLPEPADAPGLYTNMYVDCGSYDPFFFGEGVGYLNIRCFNFAGTPMVNNYYLYTTHDGGKSWNPSIYPGKALYFFSADTGWALSSKINLTDDGGLIWTPVAEVTWTAQLDFISERTGWGVATAGHEIALVHTEDGGRNWSMIVPMVGP